MWRLAPLLVATLATGCATAKLVGQGAFTPEDPGVTRTIALEPFFELAELKVTTRTEYAQLAPGSFGSPLGYGGVGSTMPQTVAVTRQVEEKPYFTRPPVLERVHDLVLKEVQRRRPSWRVVSTSGAPLIKDAEPVIVVRTVIEGDEIVASNRTLKNLAFGFGLIILPLQLVHLTPVEETVRVYGLLERFPLNGAELRKRLVKYATQPDFAVNLSGVEPLRRPFGLDLTYEEGLLADEKPRPGVLTEGFVDRLASAVIAIVEEAP